MGRMAGYEVGHGRSEFGGERVYTTTEWWLRTWQRVPHEGVSKREILRETGIHWKTLEKILTDPQPASGALPAPSGSAMTRRSRHMQSLTCRPPTKGNLKGEPRTPKFDFWKLKASVDICANLGTFEPVFSWFFTIYWHGGCPKCPPVSLHARVFQRLPKLNVAGAPSLVLDPVVPSSPPYHGQISPAQGGMESRPCGDDRL